MLFRSPVTLNLPGDLDMLSMIKSSPRFVDLYVPLQIDSCLLYTSIEPLAKNMAPLAEKRFVEGKFEDVAYFVPCLLYTSGEPRPSSPCAVHHRGAWQNS